MYRYAVVDVRNSELQLFPIAHSWCSSFVSYVVSWESEDYRNYQGQLKYLIIPGNYVQWVARRILRTVGLCAFLSSAVEHFSFVERSRFLNEGIFFTFSYGSRNSFVWRARSTLRIKPEFKFALRSLITGNSFTSANFPYKQSALYVGLQ